MILLCNATVVFSPNCSAIPECCYGAFDVWMSLDGQTWLNTTVKNILLCCGQPFYVKAMMKPYIDDVWLALFLFEPGTIKAGGESFSVVEGPCELNQGCDLGQVSSGEIKNITWKLQVKKDPFWVEGFTPLSLTSFFQKNINGSWKTEDISFSIARIYIVDSLWIEDNVTKINNDGSQINSKIYSWILPIVFFFIFLTRVFIKKRVK